jgi:hypothetical protein
VHNTELQALSEKAEAADKEARKELGRLVRDSSPEVIGRLADIGRRAGRICWPGMRPVVTLSPTEEALYAKLDAMRAEVAGENPTPLELLLLTERVVSLWMLITALCWRYLS